MTPAALVDMTGSDAAPLVVMDQEEFNGEGLKWKDDGVVILFEALW